MAQNGIAPPITALLKRYFKHSLLELFANTGFTSSTGNPAAKGKSQQNNILPYV